MTGDARPTSLTAFLPVAGDPAVLGRAMAQDPQMWLPDGGTDGYDQPSLTIHSKGATWRIPVRISQPWWSGTTLWRTVSWDALDTDDGPLGGCPHLSALDGELGLHVSPGAASLILDVRYTPAGREVDAASLHREARTTAERLLVDVAAGLTGVADVAEMPAVAVR